MLVFQYVVLSMDSSCNNDNQKGKETKRMVCIDIFLDAYRPLANRMCFGGPCLAGRRKVGTHVPCLGGVQCIMGNGHKVPLPSVWTDRQLWKHYLPATWFAGGNKYTRENLTLCNWVNRPRLIPDSHWLSWNTLFPSIVISCIPAAHTEQKFHQY